MGSDGVDADAEVYLDVIGSLHDCIPGGISVLAGVIDTCSGTLGEVEILQCGATGEHSKAVVDGDGEGYRVQCSTFSEGCALV